MRSILSRTVTTPPGVDEPDHVLDGPVGTSLHGPHGRVRPHRRPGLGPGRGAAGRPRTAELGPVLGVREGERLVAMAGVRVRPPGGTELSAVCTVPSTRGRGLASRLVRALIARVVAQGDAPFLHVASDNAAAVSLYERIEFVVRREVVFRGFTVPG